MYKQGDVVRVRYLFSDQWGVIIRVINENIPIYEILVNDQTILRISDDQFDKRLGVLYQYILVYWKEQKWLAPVYEQKYFPSVNPINLKERKKVTLPEEEVRDFINTVEMTVLITME